MRELGTYRLVRFKAGPVDPVQAQIDMIVAGLPLARPGATEGTCDLDRALGGTLSHLRAGGVLDGRLGETLVLASLPPPLHARSLLIIGSGDPLLTGPRELGELAGAAMRASLRLRCRSVACLIGMPEPHASPPRIIEAAGAMMQGALAAIDARSEPPPARLGEWIFDMRCPHHDSVAEAFAQALRQWNT